jgi:AraC-like DNA-binding protein
MANAWRLLASGSGWRVADIVCDAGPRDRPFEERHEDTCIAMVTEGTFQYRSAQGRAVLASGSVLLGNHGTCFECGHEHATGDRCLAFHFAPACFEEIVAAMPGVRRRDFMVPSLPPLPSLARLLALAESARAENDAVLFEELALRLAGAVAVTFSEDRGGAASPSRREERRITDAVRRIEAAADEEVRLAMLAREAGMSPYHFLRVFRATMGMTPYQFVLRQRLHRAAVRLRSTKDPVSSIAFGAGFNDLSTFNRRFRRVLGESPSRYRAAGRRLSATTSASDVATAARTSRHAPGAG